MSDLLPVFQLDAADPAERISKLKTLLHEALEGLDNGDVAYCADCINYASKCVQLVFDDMDDEIDSSEPVNAETTVLWLYSKLIQAGVVFDPAEQRCIDYYFCSVEPRAGS